VEYKESDQAVLLSCNKQSEQQGAFSIIIPKQTMASLGTTPSQVKLFDKGKEVSTNVSELPNVYTMQILPSLGQHELALYMKGTPNVFANPWLWLGGFAAFIALIGGLFLRMRKDRVHVRTVRTQAPHRTEQFMEKPTPVTLRRIEKFIDEKIP